MRCTTIFLAVAAAAVLLGQSFSAYRVTHAHTLGGDGSWAYVVPSRWLSTPLIAACSDDRKGSARALIARNARAIDRHCRPYGVI